MRVSLIQATPYPIDTIAKIASVCYDSAPKDPLKMVKRLYESGHESVFEHIWFTFRIEGISRVCSHQLVRHRMCAFTQRSQRYCDEAEATVVLPGQLTLQNVEVAKALNTVMALYRDMQAEGVPNEDARYVLPNATQTELYLSCNLRELIHICEERLCTRAQKEVRQVVAKMRDLVDDDLKFMLVPRCGNPRQNCMNPCGKLK